jgi:N utilization substance protein B
MAVQMLYQQDLGDRTPLAQVFKNYDLHLYHQESGGNGAPVEDGEHPTARDTATFAYARILVRGTLEHLLEIDELIQQQADNWRLERMPAVDRNILRLALYEMLYETEVPKVVVVDEAIELAKKFGSEHSGRFVNGLLDGILQQQHFPGQLK